MQTHQKYLFLVLTQKIKPNSKPMGDEFDFYLQLIISYQIMYGVLWNVASFFSCRQHLRFAT